MKSLLLKGLNTRRRKGQKVYPCGISAFPQTLKRPRQNRIVNGWEARPHSFPWIVAIFDRTRKERMVSCGGSIIDLQKKNYSNVVLTATHCFITGKKFDKPSDYYVVAGLHEVAKQDDVTVQRSNVERYLRLDFDSNVYQNDVSVVILEQPLKFTKYVRPICLPKPCGTNVPSSGCIVAGWGLQDRKPATVLQMMDITISNPKKCKEDYGDSFNHHQQICVNIPKNKRNVCRGDSGGPLFCKEDARYVQYGIVSYGASCQEMNLASVYTRVPAFLFWINHMAEIHKPKDVAEFVVLKKRIAKAAKSDLCDE